MNYILHIFIIVMFYIALGVSLNLLAGFAGLLSICHAAFWGIGAYAVAILSVEAGWSWIEAMSLGIFLAALSAFCVGYVSLRFRDDYFVIATFGFQVVIFSLMQNWVTLTKGPMGIAGIGHPSAFGFRIDSHWEFLVIVLLYALVTIAIAIRISNSPLGRVLKAIREDEVFVDSMSKNRKIVKTTVFVLSACLAAVGGGIFASYISYVDPNSFTVMESILILAIVIVGGAGNVWGPVIGSLIIIGLPELLRFAGFPASIAANVRQILYGTALVACMMWRPQGLIGRYSFRRNNFP